MRRLRIGRMARSGGRLLASAALALALGVVEARANQVFNLNGVTFDDGGTATGSFTTNDARDTLISYDITTSPGTGIGFEYTPLNSESSSTSLPTILVLDAPTVQNAANILELTFTNLTAAGSPIKLGENDSFEQTDSARRVVTGGEVVAAAVPEPASLLPGGIAALAGLGLWARKRRAH